MKFNLTTDKGSYRIDFTLEGKRKRFYPGTRDDLTARQIHRQMVYEWEMGQFDLSLQSYKLKNRKQPKLEVESKGEIEIPKLLTVWDEWVDQLELSTATRNNHYHCCRVMIEKAGSVDWNDVGWFRQSELRGSTWNIRRRFIKSATNWALEEGLISGKNPWSRLKPRKSKKSGAKPLTDKEVALVIKAFETNQFCSTHAPVKHSYYAPILKFLLLTAARPGEAIALQWRHIDFERGLIDISEAMGRDHAATPYTTRKVRKDTKTGESRYLPLTPALRELLANLKPCGAKSTALVFPGAKGGTMDTRALGKAWAKVLNGLGLEHRNFYQTRHTALTCVTQNHGLLAASRIAGHKSIDMVSRHYARFTGELTEIMPDYGNE